MIKPPIGTFAGECIRQRHLITGSSLGPIETWGLVINEAMAFGLPIVTTTGTGAAGEIVIDGDNGYVVPVADACALAEAIAKVLGSSDRQRVMGARSQTRIRSYTPEWSAGIMHRCILSAVGAPG